ncbi:glycosyltransferase family 4 protein [bacterium]|nr:glycosyltransferase family 4 protein [bacterium]
MNILWLTENYPPSRGGMSQSCDRLITSLRQNGVMVHIIHFTNRGEAFHTLRQVNGYYTALPKSNDIEHSLNLALVFIENNVDTQQYDAIIAFGGLYPIVAAPVFSKLFCLPLYVCFRGNDFDLALFNFKRRAALNEAIEQAKGIFAVSKDKINRIKALHPAANVCYTPNGIDTDNWLALKSEEHFATQWLTENNCTSKIVLGLFGYLKEKKGIYFLINAIISHDLCNKINLLMSGDQSIEIMELMDAHGISYTLLPFQDRVELIKYYLCCDWVVIPSFYDGMPNVLLEAGALGIPIIASMVDGMKDVIEHEKDGLLFKPLCEKNCASILHAAITIDIEKRQIMGANLSKKIHKKYTTANEIMPYLKTFKGALSS